MLAASPAAPAFALPVYLNDRFFDWLSRQETHTAIERIVDQVLADRKAPRVSPSSPVISVEPPSPSPSPSAAQPLSPGKIPLSPPSAHLSSPPSGSGQFPISSPPRSPQRRVGRSRDSPASPLASLVSSPSGHSKDFLSIRQFYFPDGIPVSPATKQREKSLIHEIYTQHGENSSTATGKIPQKSNNHQNNGATATPTGGILPNPSISLSLEDFYPITQLVCGFSTYFNSTLFSRLLALEPTGSERIRLSTFEQYFQDHLQNFDLPTRFHRFLRQNQRKYLIREDFSLFAQEIVARHPGLEFLQNTPEFQLKYAQTVIARIFYQVNRSGTERLTVRELKSSNFLLMAALLDTESDINKLNDYFSYEHFYVIYVRFWELDTDHNGLISIEDLHHYEEFSLTDKICERILQGAGGRGKFSSDRNSMNYLDFITFLLAEVDKTTEMSLDYWFSCLDLDSDGYLSPLELEYFFTEQQRKIQSLSQEEISFPDILCQLLDSVKPNADHGNAIALIGGAGRSGRPGASAAGGVGLLPPQDDSCLITKADLRNSKMAGTFFNTLFNLTKFIQGEQRDPQRLKQIHDTPELSDWDRFAIASYYRLAEQEQMENDEFVEANSGDRFD